MYDHTGKTLLHFKFLLTKSYPVTSHILFFFGHDAQHLGIFPDLGSNLPAGGCRVFTTGRTISEVHKYHLLLIYIVQNLFN